MEAASSSQFVFPDMERLPGEFERIPPASLDRGDQPSRQLLSVAQWQALLDRGDQPLRQPLSVAPWTRSDWRRQGEKCGALARRTVDKYVGNAGDARFDTTTIWGREAWSKTYHATAIADRFLECLRDDCYDPARGQGAAHRFSVTYQQTMARVLGGELPPEALDIRILADADLDVYEDLCQMYGESALMPMSEPSSSPSSPPKVQVAATPRVQMAVANVMEAKSLAYYFVEMRGPLGASIESLATLDYQYPDLQVNFLLKAPAASVHTISVSTRRFTGDQLYEVTLLDKDKERTELRPLGMAPGYEGTQTLFNDRDDLTIEISRILEVESRAVPYGHYEVLLINEPAPPPNGPPSFPSSPPNTSGPSGQSKAGRLRGAGDTDNEGRQRGVGDMDSEEEEGVAEVVTRWPIAAARAQPFATTPLAFVQGRDVLQFFGWLISEPGWGLDGAFEFLPYQSHYEAKPTHGAGTLQELLLGAHSLTLADGHLAGRPGTPTPLQFLIIYDVPSLAEAGRILRLCTQRRGMLSFNGCTFFWVATAEGVGLDVADREAVVAMIQSAGCSATHINGMSVEMTARETVIATSIGCSVTDVTQSVLDEIGSDWIAEGEEGEPDENDEEDGEEDDGEEQDDYVAGNHVRMSLRGAGHPSDGMSTPPARRPLPVDAATPMSCDGDDPQLGGVRPSAEDTGGTPSSMEASPEPDQVSSQAVASAVRTEWARRPCSSNSPQSPNLRYGWHAYQRWDSFDVDAALRSVEEGVQNVSVSTPSASQVPAFDYHPGTGELRAAGLQPESVGDARTLRADGCYRYTAAQLQPDEDSESDDELPTMRTAEGHKWYAALLDARRQYTLMATQESDRQLLAQDGFGRLAVTPSLVSPPPSPPQPGMGRLAFACIDLSVISVTSLCQAASLWLGHVKRQASDVVLKCFGSRTSVGGGRPTPLIVIGADDDGSTPPVAPASSTSGKRNLGEEYSRRWYASAPVGYWQEEILDQIVTLGTQREAQRHWDLRQVIRLLASQFFQQALANAVPAVGAPLEEYAGSLAYRYLDACRISASLLPANLEMVLEEVARNPERDWPLTLAAAAAARWMGCYGGAEFSACEPLTTELQKDEIGLCRAVAIIAKTLKLGVSGFDLQVLTEGSAAGSLSDFAGSEHPSDSPSTSTSAPNTGPAFNTGLPHKKRFPRSAPAPAPSGDVEPTYVPKIYPSQPLERRTHPDSSVPAGKIEVILRNQPHYMWVPKNAELMKCYIQLKAYAENPGMQHLHRIVVSAKDAHAKDARADHVMQQVALDYGLSPLSHYVFLSEWPFGTTSARIIPADMPLQSLLLSATRRVGQQPDPPKALVLYLMIVPTDQVELNPDGLMALRRTDWQWSERLCTLTKSEYRDVEWLKHEPSKVSAAPVARKSNLSCSVVSMVSAEMPKLSFVGLRLQGFASESPGAPLQSFLLRQVNTGEQLMYVDNLGDWSQERTEVDGFLRRLCVQQDITQETFDYVSRQLDIHANGRWLMLYLDDHCKSPKLVGFVAGVMVGCGEVTAEGLLTLGVSLAKCCQKALTSARLFVGMLSSSGGWRL